jgi:hypothetical protein
MPAVTAESGEQFAQPGGVFLGEKREWRERGSGGFIGAAMVAINASVTLGGVTPATLLGGGVVAVMTGGVQRSVREGVSWVPVREFASWAAGSFLLWAESVPRGPKRFYFFFLLFYFLFSLFFNLI